MITITEVRNAQSLNAENTIFDVEINHPEHGWIPYGLNPADTDMTVDNSVLLGLIGSDYAAYVAPTQAELDAEAEAMVRSERDNLLATEVDPIVANPLRWADLSATEQLEMTTYRTALLDITSQAGFPHNVVWPTL